MTASQTNLGLDSPTSKNRLVVLRSLIQVVTLNLDFQFNDNINSMGFKPKLGWILILVISFIPILLWSISLPFDSRYADFYSILTSFGQITGLVGLCMYSISIFLSARFKFVEDYFGGMSKVYISHHLLGGISFILIMIHPLFLAFAFLPNSLSSVASYLIPSDNWMINLGIVSLLLTMSLLVITFFVNLPYEFWRLTHKFLGLSLFIGVIHSFFVSSDISRDPLLKGYMFLVMLLGIIPYFYRTLLFRFFVKRNDYRIAEVDFPSDNVIEILMTPDTENISYMPGQFIFVSFEDKNLSKEIHPFSVTSIPTDKYLAFASKIEGDYTKKLMNLTLDGKAKIEGGFGRFSYFFGIKKEQIWIGGGIGITPFVSMARSLVENNSYSISLYYTVKDEAEAVFLKRLLEIEKLNVGLKVIPWYSKTNGRLSASEIYKLDVNALTKDIFVCGPPAMMKSIVEQFAKLGINKSRIHSEEFAII